MINKLVSLFPLYLDAIKDNPAIVQNFSTFILWIVIGCFFVPVFTLLIIVVIKQINKRARRAKTRKTSSQKASEYLSLFGPKENIESVDTQLNRVIIRVKDTKAIQFEELKKLNMGVLITGNVVKCSSEEFVKQIENSKK
jgi:phosphotransferase system IIB component